MTTQKFLTVLFHCASIKSHFNISPLKQRHHVAKIKKRDPSLHAVILQLHNDPKVKSLSGLGRSIRLVQTSYRVKKLVFEKMKVLEKLFCKCQNLGFFEFSKFVFEFSEFVLDVAGCNIFIL